MATETVTPASVPWWRQQLQQRRRRGGRTPPPSPSSTPVPTSSSSPISPALPISPTVSPNASPIASTTSQSATRTSSNSHQHPSSPVARTKMSAAASGSPPMERGGTGRLTGRSTSRYINADGEIVVIGAVQGSKADAPDVRSEAQGPTSGQTGRGAAVSQLGEETGSSAELQYGPGYVSRLKSRYLSMAREGTSPGSGSPRRRVVSLEDILQGEGAFERGSVQDSYVLSAARAGPWAESMRKAKSSGDLIQGRVGRGGRVGLRSPVATPRRDSSSNRGAIAVSPVRPARGIDVSQQATVRGSGVGQRPTLVVARELPAADTVSTVKRLFEERPRWVGASSNSPCGNTPLVRTCDKPALRRQQRSPQRSVQSSPQRSPNQSLQHSPQQSLQNSQDNSVQRGPQSSLQKLPLQTSKQPLNRSPKPSITPPPSQLKLRSPRQSPVKSRSLLNGRTADELRRNATRDTTESTGDNEVTNRQPESLPCLRRDLKPLPVGLLAKSNTSRRRNSLSSQVTPSSPETGSVQQDTRRTSECCVEPGTASLNAGASGRDNLRSTDTRDSGTVGIIGTESETEMSNRPVITDALKAPYASSVATLRGDEDSAKGAASTSSSVLKRQVGVIKPTPKLLPQDELNRRKNALNQAKSSASKFNTVSEKVQAFQSRSSPRALANGHRAHNKEKMASPQSADKGLTHRPALLEGAHGRNNQSHLHITNTSTSSPSAQSSAVAETPSSSRSHAVTNGMSVTPLRQFTTSPSQTTSAHPPPGDPQPKLSAPSGNGDYPHSQQHAAAPATPAAASLPPAAAAPAADTLRWHQIPDNVLVFNFTSRHGVPDYVEDDGLDIHRRAHPKRDDSGYVLLPGFNPDRASNEGCVFTLRTSEPPPPTTCDVTFLNAGVIINGRSSLRSRARHKTRSVSFNSREPTVHIYPSEASSLPSPAQTQEQQLQLQQRPAADQLLLTTGGSSAPVLMLADSCLGGDSSTDHEHPEQLPVLGPSSTNDASSGDTPGTLSSYSSARLRAASDSFQLGVSRVESAPVPDSKPPSSSTDAAEENSLRPADDSDVVVWSSDATSDMLF